MSGWVDIINLPERLYKSASVFKIEKALDRGNAVILRFDRPRFGGHYVFINDHNKRYFTTYNLKKGNSKKIMDKMLKYHKKSMANENDDGPDMWEIIQ